MGSIEVCAICDEFIDTRVNAAYQYQDWDFKWHWVCTECSKKEK